MSHTMFRSLNNYWFRAENDDCDTLAAADNDLDAIMQNFDAYMTRIDRTMYRAISDDDTIESTAAAELTADLFSAYHSTGSSKRLHFADVVELSQFTTSCSVILSLIYLDRLKQTNPTFLDKHTPEDIFVIAIIIAHKFLYDSADDRRKLMDNYVDLQKQSYDNLLKLEKEFLDAIEWQVFVSKSNFWTKLDSFEKSLALRQGLNRKFFTYTELRQLLNYKDYRNVIVYIIGVSATLMITYVVCVIAITVALNHVNRNFEIARNATAATAAAAAGDTAMLTANVDERLLKEFAEHCNLTKRDFGGLTFVERETIIRKCRAKYPQLIESLMRFDGDLAKPLTNKIHVRNFT